MNQAADPQGLPVLQNGGLRGGRVSENVLNGRLQTCSREPWTGFIRTGCCHSGLSNPDGHTVCARVTQEFLDHELECDNDLVTPEEEEDFPGLKPGGRWCICADVW